MTLADELARQQRSISVAEFFEKNKHLLGFDSPTRGLITTIKEAVDNALDACEEAQILPDIFVDVTRSGHEVFRIIVEDNGPGITPAQIPYVFGKLLYGSRFHQIRQTRGQQGIGISAAVLYAQLTTGNPAIIISRTGVGSRAHMFRILIRIETNEPEIISHDEIEWDRTHGTRVEIEFKSTLAARKRLMEYLKYTSIVNPHTRLRLVFEGESLIFDRVTSDPVVCPQAIKPHPHGIEIGQLKRMIGSSELPVADFLVDSFNRVGKKSAGEICSIAGLDPLHPVSSLSIAEQKKLLAAMQQAKIPAPPMTQCLSPIGEDLIIRGLEKEFQMDFVKARTRPSSVFGGHPFIIEAALGYGGKLPDEGNAQILRFANRVPLMYQQGACAITASIAAVTWKTYGITQAGLPTGPVIILVHVASTNVPFTSESKDAIASIPEIEREITLALQELGRDLKVFLSRRDRTKQQDDRARAVCAVIPEIAAKVSEIVGKPVPDISPIEGRLMKRLVVRRSTSGSIATIEVNNYSSQSGVISLYETSPQEASDAVPPPDFVSAVGGEYTRIWQVRIEPGSTWFVKYTGKGQGSLDVRGIDENRKVVIDCDI